MGCQSNRARKSSEEFRFISIPSGRLQLLYLSKLQSPSCHTTDKGTKGRSHLASVLGFLQFCGLCTISQRGAATPKDIRGASSPRASSLVLTSGSQWLKTRHLARTRWQNHPEQPHSYHQDLQVLPPPKDSGSGVRAGPTRLLSAPVFLRWVTNASEIGTQAAHLVCRV